MLLVVDANALFAASIKGGPSGEILFSEKFEFVTPEFIFKEFEKHKDELIGKSHCSSKEFDILFSVLLECVKSVPLEELRDFRVHAESVSPDPKDVPYFALAMKLDCPVWSNDKKLKEQSWVKVFSTEELLGLI